MITLRPALERGHFFIDWLDSWHSFSFGEYMDRAHMGWGPLRVINDDTVAPKGGFPTHSHQDMEIISYVLQGQLEHRDSLGTGSVIRAGDIQRMRAGSGIRHSEYNASAEESVHFLQIWLIPHTRGLAPGYAQEAIAAGSRDNQWLLLAAEPGAGGLIDIAAHARLYATLLHEGHTLTFEHDNPLAYVHIARGHVELNGLSLRTGDGAYIENERQLDLIAREHSEVLLFSLQR